MEAGPTPTCRPGRPGIPGTTLRPAIPGSRRRRRSSWPRTAGARRRGGGRRWPTASGATRPCVIWLAFTWFMPGQHTALYRHVVAPEGRIYFAGEHASLTHTWMQGALESALVAVREMLAAASSYRGP